MIREEWFSILKKNPHNEFIKQRTGGVGSISYTLFHIITTEHNWICDLKGIPILNLEFSSYQNDLDKIIELSQTLHRDVKEYLEKWNDGLEYKELKLTVPSGVVHCTYGEALRHIIVHEIHHIGQLSIWVREIGMKPVSANLIHKGIMLNSSK